MLVLPKVNDNDIAIMQGRRDRQIAQRIGHYSGKSQRIVKLAKWWLLIWACRRVECEQSAGANVLATRQKWRTS